MSKNTEIELKTLLTRDELVQHLHAIADSIARGRVVIEHGSRLAVLEPGDRAEVELEAEQKQGKSKLSLSISWHVPVGLSGRETFTISSEMPPDPPLFQASDGQSG